MTRQEVIRSFSECEEIKLRWKSMSDESFVVDLYKCFLDRSPDEAGYQAWLKKVKEGTSTNPSRPPEGYSIRPYTFGATNFSEQIGPGAKIAWSFTLPEWVKGLSYQANPTGDCGGDNTKSRMLTPSGKVVSQMETTQVEPGIYYVLCEVAHHAGGLGTIGLLILTW